jgi:RNA polymerase subunit RPABC4/transcription elongation factor Spt4
MPSMRKCQTCKMSISRDADVCPHCGADDPNNKKASEQLNNIIIGIVILGLIVAFGAFLVMLIPLFAAYGYLYYKRIL